LYYKRELVEFHQFSPVSHGFVIVVWLHPFSAYAQAVVPILEQVIFACVQFTRVRSVVFGDALVASTPVTATARAVAIIPNFLFIIKAAF
jgi:hypothetical protein